MNRIFVVLVFCAGSAGIAHGQSLTDRLAACQNLLGDAERLACFEAIANEAAASPSSVTQPDLSAPALGNPSAPTNEARSADAMTSESTVAAPVSAAPMPVESRPTAPAARENPRRFTAMVARAWEDPYGKLMVELDDGEVWKQTTRGSRQVPEAGSTVAVRRSAFGAWFFNFEAEGRDTRMAKVR